MQKTINLPFFPRINYFIYRRCLPEWRIPAHKVSDFDITYVIKGKALYIIDGIGHEIGAGTLLCLKEGQSKQARTYANDLMECFSVNFTPLGGKPPDLPPVSKIGLREDLVHLFHELNFAWLEKEPNYDFQCVGNLLLILHRIFELNSNNASPLDYRVKKLQRYIAQHYSEHIDLKQLAKISGLSAAYTGALFRSETGFSVQGYIAKTRVINAENMLKTGEYQVQEVSELCGYCDVFHFDKQFKAIMGSPPSHSIPRHRH